jgi:hypothetical protein
MPVHIQLEGRGGDGCAHGAFQSIGLRPMARVLTSTSEPLCSLGIGYCLISSYGCLGPLRSSTAWDSGTAAGAILTAAIALLGSVSPNVDAFLFFLVRLQNINQPLIPKGKIDRIVRATGVRKRWSCL